MLVRYCATHARHFGYPRLLGLRWNGWAISTAGGLCEACRERERNRWEADPYGQVLVPAPVELGPRMLGWRVIVATIAGAAAAAAATAVLLLVQPPDHIPSGGGDPGLLSGGARFAGPPSAQAEPQSETPVLSRRDDEAPAAPGVTAPRAAHRQRRAGAAATRGSMGGGDAGPAPGHPVTVSIAPAHRTAVVIGPGRRADLASQPVGPVTVQSP